MPCGNPALPCLPAIGDVTDTGQRKEVAEVRETDRRGVRTSLYKRRGLWISGQLSAPLRVDHLPTGPAAAIFFEGGKEKKGRYASQAVDSKLPLCYSVNEGTGRVAEWQLISETRGNFHRYAYPVGTGCVNSR